MRILLLVLSFLMFLSCADEVIIKPKSQLRLEYPTPIYENINLNTPFDFQKNKEAKLQIKRKFRT